MTTTRVYDHVRDPQEERPLDGYFASVALGQDVGEILQAFHANHREVWRAISRGPKEVVEVDPLAV